MKQYSIICLVFSLSLFACHTSPKQENSPVIQEQEVEEVYQPGVISTHVSKSNSTYELYLPGNFSKDKKYSFIIFLDPHGKGKFPLTKYTSLADRFQVCMIGSDDSKNGISMEAGEQIVAGLYSECKSLTYCDGNISLAGFSGGAKVALVSGNSTVKFNSLIYCGAALPEKSINLITPSIGFAGQKDMNYTEVVSFEKWSETVIKKTAIMVWNGKHEWPDSVSFLHAFYWHLFNRNVKADEHLLTEYNSFCDELIADERNPLRKLELIKTRIVLTEQFQDVLNYKKAMGKILLSPGYVTAKGREATILATEKNKKQELINSFTSRDLKWWEDEVNQLSREKNNVVNQRLLGYISLASYSYSNQAVESNDVNFAMKTLAIYQLADPENSEHQFLKACLYAKNNSNDSAIYYLNNAVQMGLNDRAKVENDKNLANLRGMHEFSEILAKLQ